jgi:bleomycin hydrolase
VSGTHSPVPHSRITVPRLLILTPFLLGLLCCATIAEQDSPEVEEAEPEGFVFKRQSTIPCTPVRNQGRAGTCWCFAGTSFVEAELMRKGKGEIDLSEMFVIRSSYPEKIKLHFRLHGASTIGSGAMGLDVLRLMHSAGTVPESVYGGKFAGESIHNHSEMDAVLKGMMAAVVSNPGGYVSPVWFDAVEGMLDTYLGTRPEEFTYDGKRYTPRSFAEWLEIDPDDYVVFNSYTHFPFYEEVCLNLPDNYARNLSWNVPLDDLVAIIDHSLEKGYSVAWGGDVSEKGFMHKKGIAIMPAKEWADRTSEERDSLGDVPEPELVVTQEIHQDHYDRYLSTDDHLMHFVGTASDQDGTPYYLVKNSWGTMRSEYDGFLHMSVPFVRAKTLTIIVHRDVVPEAVASKIGL